MFYNFIFRYNNFEFSLLMRAPLFTFIIYSLVIATVRPPPAVTVSSLHCRPGRSAAGPATPANRARGPGPFDFRRIGTKMSETPSVSSPSQATIEKSRISKLLIESHFQNLAKEKTERVSRFERSRSSLPFPIFSLTLRSLQASHSRTTAGATSVFSD